MDAGYRASDAEPNEPLGIELAVVDSTGAEKFDFLRFVEERIIESRFHPVPVDANGERLRMVDAS